MMKAAGLLDESDEENGDVLSQGDDKIDIKKTVDGMDSYNKKINGLSL